MACPATCVGFDWMHVYFVSGIFNSQFGLLAHALKPLGVSAESLHTYVATFNWPARVGSLTGVDVFGPKRMKSSWEEWSLRAAASEALSLIPVLGNFMQCLMQHVNTEVRQHAACFLLLVRVADMLQGSARLCMRKYHIAQYSIMLHCMFSSSLRCLVQ